MFFSKLITFFSFQIYYRLFLTQIILNLSPYLMYGIRVSIYAVFTLKLFSLYRFKVFFMQHIYRVNREMNVFPFISENFILYLRKFKSIPLLKHANKNELIILLFKYITNEIQWFLNDEDVRMRFVRMMVEAAGWRG